MPAEELPGAVSAASLSGAGVNTGVGTALGHQAAIWQRGGAGGVQPGLGCAVLQALAGMSWGLWGPLPALGDGGSLPGLHHRCPFGERAAARGTARPAARAAPGPRAESVPLRGGLR